METRGTETETEAEAEREMNAVELPVEQSVSQAEGQGGEKRSTHR